MRLLVLALCGLCTLWGAQGASVHFVDAPSQAFLKPGQQSVQDLTPAELSVVLKSLLSFEDAEGLSAASAAKVDSLLSPDIFSRPTAVLALQLAGVSKEQLEQGLGQPAQHSLELEAGRLAAAELTATVGQLGAVAQPYLARLPLDHTGLPGCSDRCVEESFKEALQTVDANYTVGNGPMAGLLSLRSSPAAPAVTLDLNSLPERLWATELATLHQTAKDAASEKRRWEAQRAAAGQAASGYMTLADATLVGMQALNAAHGAQSAQAQAAWQLQAAVMEQARQALLAAHDGRVVTMVGLLGDVPVKQSQPGSIRNLLAWQDLVQRRSMLQSGSGTVSEPHIQYFEVAAAWISSIMLVLFAFAGCYCLSTMQFKQDSLLYPRQKVE